MQKKPTYEELVQRVRELEKVENELRKTSAEISESQSSLESSLESTADGILVVAKNGSWSKFNQKFIDMWNIPDFIWEKGDDKAALEYIIGVFENPDEFMATVNYLYDNPEKESFDTFKIKDGRIFERYSVPQRMGEKIVGRVWSFRDVTRQKRAEEALRESEERFRELAEMLPEVVFETDWDLKLTYANRRAYELFGYTEEDLVNGLNGFDMFIPEDRKRLEERIARRLKGESSGRIEYQALKKDGTSFPVLFHASSIKKEGVLVGLRGIVIDITDIKNTEEGLKQAKERAETYLNIAGVIMVALDLEGNVAMINRKGCEVLGYDEADILGKNWFSSFVPESTGKQVKSVFESLLKGDITEFYENPVLTRDGSERLIAWHNTVIKDNRGEIAGNLSSGEDITDRRQAEVERARLEEQYQQVQKVESLGRLAGGVAHDLNNLLTPILGYGEILLADTTADEKWQKSVNEIVRAGFRARDLVRQLLAFGRKQNLDYRMVDLNKTVTAFEPLLRRTIREDIEIRIISSYDICTIMADVGQIEQVIMNLAVNAQDAMKGGGCLTFKISTVDLDGKHAAEHQEAKKGEYALLSVNDTGCGMDKETLKNLFEPFFTTKGEMGTGLGLATVYGIVKQHDGYIQAYSKPGKGTTMEIYLPISREKYDEKQSSITSKTAGRLKGSETILLVEDDIQVRNFSSIILKRLGYTVLEAGSAPEALAVLGSETEPVDMLLTDVILPGMNGKDLYARVVKKYPEMKVLYMSGYTDDVIAHHGVMDEGVAFIQKPFAGQALTIMVREVLDK
jgi:PAS domain S-box-containing protein